MHWMRDVTFDEDRCRVRTGGAAQVPAALRNVAIALFRLAGRTGVAAATRECAHWPEVTFRLIGPPEPRVRVLSRAWPGGNACREGPTPPRGAAPAGA
ncbi:MAG: hypothetical protein HY812_04940 [Planctomycetes bacterium]|nr:hypothetical protein [Planctomycetota bacterium]